MHVLLHGREAAPTNVEDRVVDCGEGYFGLGDDSMDSDDSRIEGPIPPNWIVGRAWLIVQPWARFGLVNR